MFKLQKLSIFQYFNTFLIPHIAPYRWSLLMDKVKENKYIFEPNQWRKWYNKLCIRNFLNFLMILPIYIKIFKLRAQEKIKKKRKIFDDMTVKNRSAKSRRVN